MLNAYVGFMRRMCVYVYRARKTVAAVLRALCALLSCTTELHYTAMLRAPCETLACGHMYAREVYLGAQRLHARCVVPAAVLTLVPHHVEGGLTLDIAVIAKDVDL